MSIHFKKIDVATGVCGLYGYAIQYASTKEEVTCKRCKQIINMIETKEMTSRKEKFSRNNEKKKSFRRDQ